MQIKSLQYNSIVPSNKCSLIIFYYYFFIAFLDDCKEKYASRPKFSISVFNLQVSKLRNWDFAVSCSSYVSVSVIQHFLGISKNVLLSQSLLPTMTSYFPLFRSPLFFFAYHLNERIIKSLMPIHVS